MNPAHLPVSRLSCALALVALAAPGQAQCNEWGGGFDSFGVSGDVFSQLVWDDGSGTALYLGGNFSSAGDIPAVGIVRWDGTTWSDVGGSFGPGSNYASDMVVFDDGSGPALYVTGRIYEAGGVAADHLVRWDGTSWSPVGPGLFGGYSGPRGASLEVWDDGTGPALYVAGAFLNGFARWDGATWTMLPISLQQAYEVKAFDDGSGSALYLSGREPDWTLGFWKWDGVSFTPLPIPTAFSTPVSLTVWDDGTGEALYAAASGGVYVLEQGAWKLLGYPPDAPWGLFLHDDGSGEHLYCAGPSISMWDGSAWSMLPGTSVDGAAWTAVPFDDGSGAGPQLYVGGRFDQVDGQLAQGISRLAPGGLEPVHQGSGSLSSVTAAVEYDDGNGARLCAVLDLGDGKDRVMSWDGEGWTQLGGTFNDDVYVLHASDATGQEQLYAGGVFTSVGGLQVNCLARWDGTAWNAIDNGVGQAGSAEPYVVAMVTHDLGSGPALVIGGRFSRAGTLMGAGRIAAWDGSAWSGFAGGVAGTIAALEVFDDGTGPMLFAGGAFDQAGVLQTKNIARWHPGGFWVSLGGLTKPVTVLRAWDDGVAPALYVGGLFQNVSGMPTGGLARWDGSAWSIGALGEVPANGRALVPYDDGEGEHLYVATKATATGNGLPPAFLFRWDGSAWKSAPGGDVNSTINELVVHDDGAGAGPSLFAAGYFTAAGSVAASYVARLTRECPCPPVVYCTSKVNSQGCTPSIGWSGTYASASQSSGFYLSTTNSLDNKAGLFFYGYQSKEVPYQGGWLCVQAPAKRTPLQNSGGVPPCGGSFSYDFNARIASGVDPALVSGTTIYGQFWSRDPGASFNTIRTDAIEFVICP